MDVSTTKQQYLSLVRPHLDYGCVVWDPYICKTFNVKAIEKVQAFASKMASKCCDARYDELPGLLDIPSLEQKEARIHFKLGLLYKIIQSWIVLLS